MGLYEKLFGGGVSNVTPQKAYEMMQGDPPVVLVDVRQPTETKSGIAPGAVLIPLSEFSGRRGELPKGCRVLTICRSGHRSPLAARQLKKAGYDVTNVSGGMLAWKSAGLPVAPPTAVEP